MAVKDFWKTVDGWCAFESLYRTVAETAQEGQTFVEVGTWQGRSACLMAELIKGKGVKFICVDPWNNGGPDLEDTEYSRKLPRPLYEIFLDNVSAGGFQMDIVPLRMLSVEAAKKFEPKSVDFIMLDGDHSYEGIKADIEAWLPKMKDGALMSGDDATWPGVEHAVREAFGDRARIHIKYKSPKNNYRLDASYWVVNL